MASQRQAVYVSRAPEPNGNYSHVVRAGNMLHIAGWMGDDPKTGKIVNGGIEAQTVGCQALLDVGPQLLSDTQTRNKPSATYKLASWQRVLLLTRSFADVYTLST